MDIIKLKEKKSLGKYKCSCGLIVRLYEEDISDNNWYNVNCWKCPCCDKVNDYGKEKQVGLRGVWVRHTSLFITLLITIVILSAIIIPVLGWTIHMRSKYKYEYKYQYKANGYWSTGYTDDDTITEISTLPEGFVIHTDLDCVDYAIGREEIKDVKRN